VLECYNLTNIREKYFTCSFCSSLKELFKNVDATTTMDFIKRNQFLPSCIVLYIPVLLIFYISYHSFRWLRFATKHPTTNGFLLCEFLTIQKTGQNVTFELLMSGSPSTLKLQLKFSRMNSYISNPRSLSASQNAHIFHRPQEYKFHEIMVCDAMFVHQAEGQNDMDLIF